ncbi:hypothetical protein ACHAXN_000810 [Cyclotella atomus]
MAGAEFMSSWDDPTIVSQRLSSPLQNRLNITSPILTSTIAPLSNHSGLSGDLSLLILTFQDDTSITLVLKRTRPNIDSQKYSKKLGLYREGVFYSTIGPWIKERLNRVVHHPNDNGDMFFFIPQALYSACDADTGQKAIVLEYYQDAAEAGVYFPHSVHNTVRKMQEAQNSKTNHSEQHTIKMTKLRKSITLEASRIAALLQGSFYQDKSLFTNHQSFAKHLRMVDWIQGKNKESYVESQQEIVDRWSRAKSRRINGEFFDGKVQLSQEFVQVMDASCALALDFDLFVSKWNLDGRSDNKLSWSLVHGDYHPGNFLFIKDAMGTDIMNDGYRPKLMLVDWEVVGVGSGPQDLGQFLISHTETKEAFNLLDEVATVYRQTLQSTLDAVNGDSSSDKPTVPALEAIKREIIYGGIERWVWLFAYMTGWEESMPWMYMQFFHDQMQNFIVINNIRAEDVGMPRP